MGEYESIVRNTVIVLVGIFFVSLLAINVATDDPWKSIAVNIFTDSLGLAFAFFVIDRASKARKAIEKAPVRRVAISGLMIPIREFSKMIANLALDAVDRRPTAPDPLDRANLERMISFNLINTARCVTTLYGPIEWRRHYLFEVKSLSSSIERTITNFGAYFEPHEVEIMNNCLQSGFLRRVIENESLVLSSFQDNRFTLSVVVASPENEFRAIVAFIEWVQRMAADLKIEPNNAFLPSHFDLAEQSNTQYWF